MIFKSKWKKQYNDLTHALKEIMLMQMKEGGEREIIANEILQSLSMSLDFLQKTFSTYIILINCLVAQVSR